MAERQFYYIKFYDMTIIRALKLIKVDRYHEFTPIALYESVNEHEPVAHAHSFAQIFDMVHLWLKK